METEGTKPEYAGFWIRVLATMIDTILLAVLLAPVTRFWTGAGPSLTGGGALNFLLPAIAIIAFWNWRSATPGKLLLRLEIVDANTLAKPTMSQWILRYLGYIVSTVVLCLGFLWIALDDRKRGWHDMIATTLVVRRPRP